MHVLMVFIIFHHMPGLQTCRCCSRDW